MSFPVFLISYASNKNYIFHCMFKLNIPVKSGMLT